VEIREIPKNSSCVYMPTLLRCKVCNVTPRVELFMNNPTGPVIDYIKGYVTMSISCRHEHSRVECHLSNHTMIDVYKMWNDLQKEMYARITVDNSHPLLIPIDKVSDHINESIKPLGSEADNIKIEFTMHGKEEIDSLPEFEGW